MTIATVEDPCIVFTNAAMKNIESILAKPDTLLRLKSLIIPDSLIIYPIAPPAPVINKISNEFFKDLINHCGVSFVFHLS